MIKTKRRPLQSNIIASWGMIVLKFLMKKKIMYRKRVFIHPINNQLWKYFTEDKNYYPRPTAEKDTHRMPRVWVWWHNLYKTETNVENEIAPYTVQFLTLIFRSLYLQSLTVLLMCEVLLLFCGVCSFWSSIMFFWLLNESWSFYCFFLSTIVIDCQIIAPVDKNKLCWW